jgi:hypothetical protein
MPRKARPRKKSRSEALRKLGGSVRAAVGQIQQGRQFQAQQDRLTREAELGRAERAETRADRLSREEAARQSSAEAAASKREFDIEQAQLDRAIQSGKLDLAREKFEFEKTHPKGSARDPFKFEVQIASIDKALTPDINQSPLRFQLMDVAKKLSSTPGFNPDDANFFGDIMTGLKDSFGDDLDPVALGMLANYMVENMDELPLPPASEEQKAAIGSTIADFIKTTLRGAAGVASAPLGVGALGGNLGRILGQKFFGEAPQPRAQPQTIDDINAVIDARLKGK